MEAEHDRDEDLRTRLVEHKDLFVNMKAFVRLSVGDWYRVSIGMREDSLIHTQLLRSFGNIDLALYLYEATNASPVFQ